LTNPTDLTITGPVSDANGTKTNLLTISGDNKNRAFYINGGTTTLYGLTISDGSAGSGGGGYTKGGTQKPRHCTISGKHANDSGGGLYTNSTSSTAPAGVGNTTLDHVTFSATSAKNGGGLNNHSAGTIKLSNVTLSNNTASNAGGG